MWTSLELLRRHHDTRFRAVEKKALTTVQLLAVRLDRIAADIRKRERHEVGVALESLRGGHEAPIHLWWAS